MVIDEREFFTALGRFLNSSKFAHYKFYGEGVNQFFDGAMTCMRAMLGRYVVGSFRRDTAFWEGYQDMRFFLEKVLGK